MCSPFGWHELQRPKLEEILQKLGQFESMTWNEILVKHKKRNHSVEVYKLCSRAQKRLETLRLDLDQIVSLRLSGEERVWGYRIEHTLNLLWWDPLHEVCPSEKRNT
jgi:hypothetical protein